MAASSASVPGWPISFSSLLAQKMDSLLQVQWESGLKKMKNADYNDAAIQFSQLINSGFSNKEVYNTRIHQQAGVK
jgi:hypothetical protein